MGEHLRGDLESLTAGEPERVGPVREAAQVEIVHHFFHQVADVLDQRDLTVDVPCRAQPVEHLEAEPVRGLDRGGVEAGDGLAQAIPPGHHLVRRRRGQELHDLVVPVTAGPLEDVDQPVVRAHQTLAHLVAQLAGRHAGEGDHEEPVDGQDALRHVPGRQGGDGEGLAGAGARLEQRHPGRQLATRVEGLGCAVRGEGHRSVSTSWSRRPAQSRLARLANRVGAAGSHASSSACGGPVRCSISSEVQDPPEHERVLGLLVLSFVVVGRFPRAGGRGRRVGGVLPVGRGDGPGGRRPAEERQRLAHAAVEQVDQCAEVLLGDLPAARRIRPERADRGHRGRAVAPGAPADRSGLEGPLRPGGAQGEQARPRDETGRRAEPRIGHAVQDVAAHARHRPHQVEAAAPRHAHVHGGRRHGRAAHRHQVLERTG